MFKSIKVASSRSSVPVRGVFSNERAALPRTLQSPGFKGDIGDVAHAHGSVLLGLGDRESLTSHALRKAGAALVKGLERMEIHAVSIEFDMSPDDLTDQDDATAASIGRCVGEGAGLANWRVDFFDGTASQTDKPAGVLSLHTADRSIANGIRRGLALAESANYARQVAATPPNICNPTWMAKEARKLARSFPNLTCKVIDFAEAKKLGMGGLINVGKASKSKPCLIQIEYKPAADGSSRSGSKGKPIVLVGKTITYDTGGYSLKISNGMKGMKYDKNGGMAVLGAMHAVASLKPKRRVIALLPTAENMVSGEAYRPDDIITMYNGVTVEVTNTDAEGRLVLADALAYACAKLRPEAIIDAATLTGGVVVALGSWSAGLFCEDDALRERVYAAADTSGEMVWRLPLWEEHRKFMRSKHADIWNSGPKRDGHPIQGAAFLSYFVDEDIPWAHIDIAGVSAVDSDTDLFVTGPTGFGVRLLSDLITNWK